MDLGTALVIVAAIGAFYQLRSRRHGMGGFRRRTSEDGRHDAPFSPREAELLREVEQLRERVHVLERITTDGRPTRALADEIENLRDR